MIIDFHCHLYDFGKTLSEEIAKAKLQGINKWISTALTPDEFQWHLKKGFLFVAGIHPYYLENSEFNFDSYLQNIYNCSDESFWGIGEIGLDTRNKNLEHQKTIFIKQVKIAMELDKPIIIHSVKSYYEIFKILKTFNPKIPIIFHCFNGSNEIVDLYKNFNAYFSINNQILRKKNAGKILEKLYLSKKLLFETDANYQRKDLFNLRNTLNQVAVKLEIQVDDILSYYDEMCKKLYEKKSR